MHILHLTDVHISASADASLHGVKPWQTWHQVWADINQCFDLKQFSALVLSGDISHDDSPESYQHVAETLTEFPGKIVYFPGNHDNYDIMQRVFMQAGLPSERLLVLDDWVIIGLNTQQPGKIYGKLASTELQWLDNCLQQYADKKVVIFTHHHTLKIQSLWLDSIRLINAKALLKIIDAHNNVHAVVNGHVHQANKKMRKGVQYLATPATCMQSKAKTWAFKRDDLPPGYRVFECDDELSSKVYYVSSVSNMHIDGTSC